MSFGRHLRALRDEAGLSGAELARRAGVPASTLRSWENDSGFPSLAAGLRLAGALGVAVGRFAEGVERPRRMWKEKTPLGQNSSPRRPGPRPAEEDVRVLVLPGLWLGLPEVGASLRRLAFNRNEGLLE
jgi:putative transcriptional regulator